MYDREWVKRENWANGNLAFYYLKCNIAAEAIGGVHNINTCTFSDGDYKLRELLK